MKGPKMGKTIQVELHLDRMGCLYGYPMREDVRAWIAGMLLEAGLWKEDRGESVLFLQSREEWRTVLEDTFYASPRAIRSLEEGWSVRLRVDPRYFASTCGADIC